jgi:CBS domain-containing protein
MSTQATSRRGSGLDPALARATVGDVMHIGVFSCPPDATLRQVADAMASESIHAVVVEGVARGGPGGERLIWGVASDLDVAAAFSLGPDGVTAAEVACTEPVTILAHEALTHAARLMSEHGVAHLIVVGRDGTPTGVVSTMDLARALAWGVGGIA